LGSKTYARFNDFIQSAVFEPFALRPLTKDEWQPILDKVLNFVPAGNVWSHRESGTVIKSVIAATSNSPSAGCGGIGVAPWQDSSGKERSSGQGRRRRIAANTAMANSLYLGRHFLSRHVLGGLVVKNG
jgi:hypothetical protein